MVGGFGLALLALVAIAAAFLISLHLSLKENLMSVMLFAFGVTLMIYDAVFGGIAGWVWGIPMFIGFIWFIFAVIFLAFTTAGRDALAVWRVKKTIQG